MSRIVFAWELGGDFGHLAGFVPVARELARRSHAVDWVLRDLSNVETALAGEPFRVFQAPLWTTPITGLPPPVNFAETLLNFGYHEPDGLAGMLRGWRALYETLQPDLLVADHAPTALLAARGLPLRTVLYGAPFGAPPRRSPLPAYRWWNPEPEARLADVCRHVTQIVNAALAKIGAPPVVALADIFAAGDELLLSVPELDHYGAREGAGYVGPLFGLSGGNPPRWPIAGKGRVFAYVKPGYRHCEHALQALAQCGASAVVVAPGVAARTVKTYSSATLAFSGPVEIEAARRDCDVGICHGGMGTTAALLLAGKPVLLLPMQMEQFMLAKRVEALGAGLTITGEGAFDLRRPLKRLLTEPVFARAASAFADRYRDLDATKQVAAAADRCQALLARAPA